MKDLDNQTIIKLFLFSFYFESSLQDLEGGKAKKKSRSYIKHQDLVKRVLSFLLFSLFYFVIYFLLLLLDHVSWLSPLFVRIARKNDSMNYIFIFFIVHE